MLVLTRKRNESIILGNNIEITVLDIDGDKIKIGIEAPMSISILRKEVYNEVAEVNKQAIANNFPGNLSFDKIFKNNK